MSCTGPLQRADRSHIKQKGALGRLVALHPPSTSELIFRQREHALAALRADDRRFEPARLHE
ncbi:hypothetical protein, partial [Burkholderia ubonensis]|uniref:hypothetical protein n=1 Tax=Burkholderia ubonensis TaxID=101571 RepID=UPI001E657E50